MSSNVLVSLHLPTITLLVLGSKRTYGDGSDPIIRMDVDVSDTIEVAVRRLHDELDIEPCHQQWVFEEQPPRAQLEPSGTPAIAS